MTHEVGDQDHTVSAASIGAKAAQARGSYDTTQWQQGGYEASSWDSGPDYVPYRPQPAPRRRTLVAAILALVMVGLVAVAAFGLWKTFSNETTPMTIGSCIVATKDGDQWSTRQADCKSSDPVNYTIVSKLDGSATCPDPYTPVHYLDNESSPRRTYCLMENLTQDSCYATGADSQLTKVACDDPSAKAKVAQRIDGSADENRCATGEQVVLFGDTPQRTYCLTQPTAP